MRATIAVALLLFVPAAHAEAADGKLKVFILAGQSNMAGQGQADELSEEFKQPLANVFVPVPRTGGLMPYKPQGRIGPEASFAHELAKAWPGEKIVLVKLAIGGTSALAWSPEWTAEKAKLTGNERQQSLYKRLMEQVQQLLENQDAEVVGMLWAQGGRDAKYEAAAAEYAANLTAIITAVRKDLDRPKLPFIFARTPDLPPRGFPHVDQVRAAQQQVAKQVPQTRLILTDDLSQRGDDTHFDTVGQIEQGRRFAKAFFELTKQE